MMCSLSSINKQNQNQATFENVAYDPTITNAISQVNNYTKRKCGDNYASAKIIYEDREKAARIIPRD